MGSVKEHVFRRITGKRRRQIDERRTMSGLVLGKRQVQVGARREEMCYPYQSQIRDGPDESTREQQKSGSVTTVAAIPSRETAAIRRETHVEGGDDYRFPNWAGELPDCVDGEGEDRGLSDCGLQRRTSSSVPREKPLATDADIPDAICSKYMPFSDPTPIRQASVCAHVVGAKMRIADGRRSRGHEKQRPLHQLSPPP